MANRSLGEIFVGIRGDLSKLQGDFDKAKKMGVDAAKGIEESFKGIGGGAGGGIANQISLGQAALGKYKDEIFKYTKATSLSSEQIKKHNDAIKAGIPDQEAWNRAIGKGSDGATFFGHNINSLMKRIILTHLALQALYGALDFVKQGFLSGLAAVEDYGLKVASMGAFLTTFNKNLTATNAAEIYKASNDEAKNLVSTMEILDARTIASGKDLTTMAEQFIKGGVKIDTANKGAMDGFVNIANALKLLTKGQNQEIQMRQEIRALTQGQVRDQNIVVQTLKGIDPQIKEHIKLWKQQGTLLENVGKLLAGFGPAAKELENTWAVVGSTMETITNRILRDAFKPTYESLVQTAKEWNSALMDSEGNLTGLANGISSMLNGVLLFSKNLLEVAGYVAVGGVIYLGIAGIIKLIEIKLVGAIFALNAAVAKNPLFAAAILALSVTSVKAWADSVTNDMKKIEEESKRSLTTWEKFKSAFAESAGIMFSSKPFTDFFGLIINWVDIAIIKVSELLKKMGLLSNMASGGSVEDANKLTERQIKEMQTRQAPTISTGNILEGIFPLVEGQMGSNDISENMKEMDKYLKQLQEQAIKVKDSARGTLEAKIANGEFADSFKELRDGGHLANTTLDEWLEKSRKAADAVDADKIGEKSKQTWESASKSIEGTITSLRSMNLEQEKSQEAIWRSKFASDSYRKELGMSIEQFEKFKKSYSEMVIAEAKEADERKKVIDSNKIIDDSYDKLKTKLESLQAAPGETEQLLTWENAFIEAMFQAGSSVSITGEELDKLYEKMSKFDEMMGKTKAAVGEKEVKESNIRLDKLMEQIFPNEKRELKGETLKDKLDKEKALWNTYTDEQKTLSEMTEESWAKAYEGIAARNDTWLNGAMDGLSKYANNTTSAFKTASDAVEKAFKSMEDALVEFVSTGKIDFGNLIDSMITDLIRLQIQQSITQPLAEGSSSILGTIGTAIAGMLGGSGGGTPEAFSQVSAYDSMVGTSQSFSMTSANGNAFNPQGHMQAFANGGAFTNSIVSKPTLFPFAKGTGLMGEAGPEAIMPLERGPSGKLGVSASGMGGTIVNVNVINNADADVKTKSTPDGNGGINLEVMIDKVVGKKTSEFGSSTNKSLRQGFGASPMLASR